MSAVGNERRIPMGVVDRIFSFFVFWTFLFLAWIYFFVQIGESCGHDYIGSLNGLSLFPSTSFLISMPARDIHVVQDSPPPRRPTCFCLLFPRVMSCQAYLRSIPEEMKYHIQHLYPTSNPDVYQARPKP